MQHKRLSLLPGLFPFLFFSLLVTQLPAQTGKPDSIKPDYRKIYGYALQGNIKSALALLPADSSAHISEKDKAFIKKFKDRFGYETDRNSDLAEPASPVDSLLKIFRDYWWLSLENETQNYDSILTINLTRFLSGKFDLGIVPSTMPADKIDKYIIKYIVSNGLHTTGFGRTGKLYDLLVWRKQTDTVYKFQVLKEKIKAPVVFMDNFVTLGWEEYSTWGAYYPGGWTTKEAIFCVKKAYDLKSEDFLVDLLAHEGRHFGDASLFPKLGSADLEYRAKLVELCLLKESLYRTIEFFINQSDRSNYQNAHPFANYCVVRDLSEVLFHSEPEKNMNKWKAVPWSTINTAAEKLLIQNTGELKRLGSKDVKQLIK